MKVYVINLPSATDRLTSITNEMEKTELNYEIITPETSDEIVSKNPAWTTGANSLRLTTIKLIEKAIKEEEDSIWIWEDDSIIDKAAFDYFMKHKDLLYDYDFIHLNHSVGKHFSLQNVGPLHKTLDGVECCQSYLINESVFHDYLNALKVKRPIDLSTKMLHRQRQNSFIVEPNPVTHKKGEYSCIRDKVVEY